MLPERSFFIIERETSNRIQAEIRPVKPSDKVLWTHWHGEMPPDAEDAHWEWDRFMDWPTFYPERFAVYALEAVGELQGLRMLEISEGRRGAVRHPCSPPFHRTLEPAASSAL
jgi:hypothetical protein